MLRWLSNIKKTKRKAGNFLLFFSTLNKKKFSFFYLLLLGGFFLKAQNNFNAIDSLFKKKYPGVDTEDRIWMINFWSPDNYESRIYNKEMRRVWHIFQRAKMKNAEKGALLILIATTDNEPFVNMALRKDSIFDGYIIRLNDHEKEMVFKMYKIGELPSSIFLNGNANLISRNPSKEKIAKLMKDQLIRTK
jgi:hypothetical protein